MGCSSSKPSTAKGSAPVRFRSQFSSSRLVLSRLVSSHCQFLLPPFFLPLDGWTDAGWQRQQRGRGNVGATATPPRVVYPLWGRLARSTPFIPVLLLSFFPLIIFSSFILFYSSQCHPPCPSLPIIFAPPLVGKHSHPKSFWLRRLFHHCLLPTPKG